MLLLLILPTLVAGFIVCNHDPRFFYRLHRYEGQYLYLKSAWLGSLCLMATTFLVLLIEPNGVALVERLLADTLRPAPDERLTTAALIVTLSVGTILCALLWSLLSKGLLMVKAKGSLDRAKTLLMAQVLSDSPLDELLLGSYLYRRPLILTLESRKVYVGIVRSLGEPNENEGMDQEISLVPLVSGYRDKEGLEVRFTTHYDGVIGSDLTIVIRQDQILTASWFDFDTHRKLNEGESPEPQCR